MKNTRAMLSPVYTRKMPDSDKPISAAYVQKPALAAPRLIRSMRKLNNTTSASGASSTTQKSGVAAIDAYKPLAAPTYAIAPVSIRPAAM
jgi:hypothetical protein